MFNITTINNLIKIYNSEDKNKNNSLHRYILLSKQEQNSQLDSSEGVKKELGLLIIRKKIDIKQHK